MEHDADVVHKRPQFIISTLNRSLYEGNRDDMLHVDVSCRHVTQALSRKLALCGELQRQMQFTNVPKSGQTIVVCIVEGVYFGGRHEKCGVCIRSKLRDLPMHEGFRKHSTTLQVRHLAAKHGK